jgi:hypothetical protein
MKGWQQLLQAAAKPLAAFEAALSDPQHAQNELLMRIVRANADTEFGREHDFANIHSAGDYRSAVRIRSYAQFDNQIRRIASGEAGVLTSSLAVAFEETGGTASGSKLIPYTAESLASFREAVLPWLSDLAGRRPGICAGKTYVSISPVTRQQRVLPGGIPIGLGSDAAYLGDELMQAFLSILAVQPGVATLADINAWRLATLTELVECEELSFVSAWSPTFILNLIEAIPSLASSLALKLSRPAQKRLTAFIQRSCKDTTPLWPQLDTISCWSDGSSSVFAARLASLCPQALIEPKGLFATEAAITLPWGGREGCVPALTSTYVEFIDDDGRPHIAHELDAGAGYRVVITTPGGLYRYDMGDRVRCVGHDGKVARLKFEGRAGMTSDMVGEKLDEAFVTKALAGLPCAAALLPKTHPKPHYELWLDAVAVDQNSSSEAAETGLCQNPQYAYARKVGQLGALAPHAKPGFVSDLHDLRADAGSRLGDMKHSSLILE